MAVSTVNVFKCLVVLVAFSASTTQGRSSRRIHNRHHDRSRSLSDLDFEIEMIEQLERDLESGNLRAEQHTGHREEDPSDILRVSEDRYRPGLPWSLARLHAIAKRHNERYVKNEDAVAHEIMSEEDESELMKSRNTHRPGMLDKARKKRYEVEIKEAQNSSLCNYTVIDIPDLSEDQSRTPKKLFDVKCNHTGSRCRHTGTYYCIQTYGKVEVSYGNGTTNVMKIYTGCVCSLRLYGELNPYTTSIRHEWKNQ